MDDKKKKYNKNINGKLALGYGSKYQLLRMLGWHRNELNSVLSQRLNVDGNINWLDFGFAGPCDKELLNLDFIPELKDSWRDYWMCGGPNNGLNWDAVGISSDGTYILVEAKAHLKEFDSRASGKSESRTKNNQKINLFLQKYKINSSADSWSTNFYQFANRLVITDYVLSRGYKVKLVYLLFENGFEYNCTPNSASRAEWEQKIEQELVATGVKGTEAEKLVNVCVINCNRKKN